jgi:hypothetical protein
VLTEMNLRSEFTGGVLGAFFRSVCFV